MPESRAVAHLVRGFLRPTETFIADQLTSLRRFRPVVVCHHLRPHPARPEVMRICLQEDLPPRARRWDRICYGTARWLPPFSAKYLARCAAAEEARLLHFHYLVDARFFLPFRRRAQVPAVVSAYGYDVSSFPRRFWGIGRRYLQPVFREVDCVLAMSEDMRRDLIQLGCPPERIRIHYYGIDTGRFAAPGRLYSEKQVVDILVVGTLELKKGQDRVLRALRLWEDRARSRISFRLTLVGGGPLRPRLERMIRDYGWSDRVLLLGHVPHRDPRLADEYRKADLFTLPSATFHGKKEGIPGTLVEAMASGLPVVSTLHAGIPEMIQHEETGLLVDEADLEGLSRALGRLIEDSDLRARLGSAAARSVMTRCSLETKTEELELIYDQLLAGSFHGGV